MSDDIICPECKSRDVQKIENERIVTTNAGCINTSIVKKVTIVCSILGVVLGFIVGIWMGISDSGTGFFGGIFLGLFGGIFYGIVFGLMIGLAVGVAHTFLAKREESTQSKITDWYYVCRSCGKEFRAN
jgi:DNA-directed RNA polymerase subunit RPC12/RpoP